MKYLFISCLFILLVISCKPSAPATAEATADMQAPLADTSATTIVNIPGLKKLWDTDKTLITSESVLYDKANDLLYVSCINGVPPDKKDNDGYISRVGMDGKVKDLKWVTGLSGPKGMGLSGNTLYVTDIDRLVSIDITTGKITNSWNVKGASFLNDVFVSDDKVYFTDSNTSTIYSLMNGKVSTVFQDTLFGGANGILVEGNTIFLAGYTSGVVFKYDLGTQSIEKVATDIPGGDGMERYGDALIVSNWDGQIYHVTANGEATLLLDSQEAKLNAADIEIIADKNMMLVPTFFGNGVTAYALTDNK